MTERAIQVERAMVLESAVESERLTPRPRCIGCGCTDDNACCEGMRDGFPITCHWVAPEICSRCRTIAEISYAHATGRPWLFEQLEAQAARRITL